jgi:hypothetical protein
MLTAPCVQAPDSARGRVAKEIECYTKLVQLDPRRRGFYEDQIVALKALG